MPENTPVLKFMANMDYPISLLFDQPKVGEGQYGAWYRYAVNHNKTEWAIFASEGLNAQLSTYGKGSNLNIRKEEYEPGKTKFVVTALEGAVKAPPATLNTPNSTTTDRTQDIHRQVCLKLAVQSMGTSKMDFDFVEVGLRMDGLLNILDGEVKKEPVSDEDLPF